MKGHADSAETRARKSAARIGMKFSDEHRATLSAAHRGKTASAATRAKMSATRTGRVQSPEARAKVSAARLGMKFSAEHVARIREAGKRGTAIGYKTAHWRAWSTIPPDCEEADGTCKGGLDAAFRHDAPVEFVRHRSDGTPYYVGPDPLAGYRRLCRSHHVRYDRH